MAPSRVTVTAATVSALLVMASGPSYAAGPKNVEWKAKASDASRGGAIQTELTVGGGTPGGSGTGQKGGPGQLGGDPGPGPTNPGGTSASQEMVTEFTRVTGKCWSSHDITDFDQPPKKVAVAHVRIDRSGPTPRELTVGAECVPPDDPRAQAPLPPPPPPTVTEITDLARSAVVAPQIGVSPDSRGITGVATRFWYDGPREAAVSSAIRGYQITATARPTRFYWNPGDGSELLSSSRPGTEDNWAAEHVYRTKDYYTVTAQAVWEGDWSLTGHGASASGQLATIRTSSTREYQVNEFRGQLRDTR